jgi:hypothetical protein
MGDYGEPNAPRVLWAAVILALFAPVIVAQTVPEPIRLGNLTFEASIHTRVEMWNWFPASGENQYVYPASLFRFGIRQNRPRYECFLEFAAPVLLGLPDGSIAPGAHGQLGLGATYFAANGRPQNTVLLFLKQGFITFRRSAGPRVRSLRIGRFEFADGRTLFRRKATLAALKRDRINQRLISSHQVEMMNFRFASSAQHKARCIPFVHIEICRVTASEPERLPDRRQGLPQIIQLRSGPSSESLGEGSAGLANSA